MGSEKMMGAALDVAGAMAVELVVLVVQCSVARVAGADSRIIKEREVELRARLVGSERVRKFIARGRRRKCRCGGSWCRKQFARGRRRKSRIGGSWCWCWCYSWCGCLNGRRSCCCLQFSRGECRADGALAGDGKLSSLGACACCCVDGVHARKREFGKERKLELLGANRNRRDCSVVQVHVRLRELSSLQDLLLALGRDHAITKFAHGAASLQVDGLGKDVEAKAGHNPRDCFVEHKAVLSLLVVVKVADFRAMQGAAAHLDVDVGGAEIRHSAAVLNNHACGQTVNQHEKLRFVDVGKFEICGCVCCTNSNFFHGHEGQVFEGDESGGSCSRRCRRRRGAVALLVWVKLGMFLPALGFDVAGLTAVVALGTFVLGVFLMDIFAICTVATVACLGEVTAELFACVGVD